MIKTTEIKKLADLARINLSDHEVEALRAETEAILAFVAEIEQAAGEYHPTPGEVYNVMREDADPHENNTFSEVLLGEASKTEGGFIKVKKIL